MWHLGNRFRYPIATPKRVVGVVIDPRRVYPDVERRNNRWGR